MRRTKILATLGPATDKEGVLESLFKAGVDVVRLNFSHGSAQDHIHRAQQVREVSQKMNWQVGILADLQGPKIRIARFKNKKVFLNEGQRFALDINVGENDGDHGQVGITYKPLAQEVQLGNRLLLDDGRIVLEVVAVYNGRVNCIVITGGDLSDNKGINLMGGGLSAPALTEKDKEDIKTIAQIGCDYVAVSFPRCAKDIHDTRWLLGEAGCQASLVAKIERAEAVASDEVMDEIILASDVIMVARGDLGVEIGDANLPAMQKKLIKRACELDRLTITATQMMESMIENPIPTRAEVFDVANAVYDGTDAIMLSAETASGKYPVKAVEAMSRICIEAEKQDAVKVSHHRVDREFKRDEESIAMAAMYMANHTNVTGIAALTETGTTPLLMSRISSAMPIFALSCQPKTLSKVTLYRGVIPIYFSHEAQTHIEVNRDIVAQLRSYGMAKTGDKFIITKGDLVGTKGSTNELKVITVGHDLTP